MANLVVITSGITSKLITSTELCTRLQDAGHSVTLMAPQTADVKATAINCISFDLKLRRPPKNHRTEVNNHSSRFIAKLWQRLSDRITLAQRCRATVAGLDVTGFQEQLLALEPDLVLIDIESYECIIAALQAGHRVALINVFFNLWKRPSVPPLHVKNMPGQGIRGTRLGIEMTWWHYRLWIATLHLRAYLNPAHYLALTKTYAQRLQFPLKTECDYFQALIPFVYPRLPMLTLNLSELDLPHQPHPTSFYVGPMTNIQRTQFAFSEKAAEVMREVDDFFAQGTGHKLIYCAFGSYFYGNDANFWKQLIAAAEKNPQWRFVLGLGNRMTQEQLGPIPVNVRAYQWAPQLDILARADCAVIHGGMTSVYECIYHRVPMVVYPYAEIFDQFGTATRVGFHRLGLVGDRRNDDADVIAARINKALTDHEISSNLEKMRQHMQRYVDDKLAERAIESIIDNYPAHSISM